MKTLFEIRPRIKGLAFCTKDDLVAGLIYIEISKDGSFHIGVFDGSHIIKDGLCSRRCIKNTSRYANVTSIITELEISDWIGE